MIEKLKTSTFATLFTIVKQLESKINEMVDVLNNVTERKDNQNG